MKKLDRIYTLECTQTDNRMRWYGHILRMNEERTFQRFQHENKRKMLKKGT
jgi:hypothetical protein